MASPLAISVVPFLAAIEAARRRRVVLPAEFYRELQESVARAAFTVSSLTTVEQINAVKDLLTKSLEVGGTFAEFKQAAIDGRLPLAIPATVYRNAIQTSTMIGRWQETIEFAEQFPVLLYDAVDDSRTRPTHAAMDGYMAPVSDPIWEQWYPPNGHNCFLPETKIAGAIINASKVWYSGDVIEIETLAGHRLAVTINHPIAAKQGWVAAGALCEGDYLYSDQAEVEVVRGLRTVTNYQQPLRAEDLFNAMSLQAADKVVGSVAALDFHGDGKFCQGEVYTVFPARSLVKNTYAEVFQRLGKLLLPWIDPRLILEFAKGPFLDSFVGAGGSSDSIMSRASLFSTLGSGHTTPLKKFSLGSTALNYPNAVEEAHDTDAAYAVFISKLLRGSAGMIALDKIVKIRRYEFSGHVYNFQSESGLINASNIISRNCRCTAISLTNEQAVARGFDGRPPPSGDPDPGWGFNPGKTYQQELNSLLETALSGAPLTVTPPKSSAELTSLLSRDYDKLLRTAFGSPALLRARTTMRPIEGLRGGLTDVQLIGLQLFLTDQAVFKKLNDFLHGGPGELDLALVYYGLIDVVEALAPVRPTALTGLNRYHLALTPAMKKAYKVGTVIKYSSFATAVVGELQPTAKLAAVVTISPPEAVLSTARAAPLELSAETAIYPPGTKFLVTAVVDEAGKPLQVTLVETDKDEDVIF